MRKLLFLLFISSSCYSKAQVKPTTAKERLKLIDQRKSLNQQSKINETAFRNIGPSVMSGRVVDIDVNPTDATEFYIAYATGGLWHTVNNGISFVPVFDSVDIVTIGDIAINWNNREIWVGTGEVNSSRSSYAGLGIYKSTNNGKTWDWMGLPESHHIGKVQLHPTDPNTAWVAVLGHLYSANKERGVYKTVDGGKTWKQVLFVDENTGSVDLDINPINPNELYAALWFRTRRANNFEECGKTSGIYKSMDGGDNWELISTPTSGFPSGEGVGRIGLSLYPKNPTILYAVVDNNFKSATTISALSKDSSKYVLADFKLLSKEQFALLDDKKLNDFIKSPRTLIPTKYNAANLKEMVATDQLAPTAIYDFLFDANTALFETPIIGCELYRSDDAGKTWRKTNEYPINIYSTYGYYFGMAFVSPTNENKIILTGVDLMMSTDGGKTFKSINGPVVHSDHHFVWMDTHKDGHIINGNDGGVNMTYDNGKNWAKLNTPAVGQFYSVTVDMARPYNVYGGLQDNGTWFGPANNLESTRWYGTGDYAFKSIGGGDGMQVQVDWRDNKTVYSGYQFGNYNRQVLGATGSLRERSKSVQPSRELGQSALRFNWQSPILISRHNQDIFYFGSNKLHRSFNKGDSLVAMGGDLTTNPLQGDIPFGTLSTISESPLRFGLIYTGSDDGNIQVTKDGGYSWNLINRKLPKGLYVSRVVASAFKEGRVYAALNGYRNDYFAALIYKSEDYGATWKQVNTDLPMEPVNVIREDPTNENILYIGTDGGLYISLDGGLTSMMWSKGLPYSISVHDIAIQPRDNEIVLGTHGRSIYIAGLSGVQKAAQKK
ncbi:MAG: glycosyl hydrolase [Sphingobacteriia bacterium]|nr:MAG: glycosyl hydrolase [Sphingobacteriia bacterium]TAG32120.1 MAG: glycosyl hydrolase [Sphingobacteriia bacterium]